MATIDDFKKDGEWVKRLSAKIRSEYGSSTKAYKLWSDVKGRCNPKSAFVKAKPTYLFCTMSEKFQDFQFFAEWCNSKAAYNLTDYQLDKDILGDNTLVYSEEHCVFVPKGLNSFFSHSGFRKGDFPHGVSAYPRGGPSCYSAKISIDSKSKHLGYFNNVPDASEAYWKAKTQEAVKWADRLDPNVVDCRVITRLKYLVNSGELRSLWSRETN